MSDFFSAGADADAAIARIEQQVAEAQERAKGAEVLRTDIDALRATSTSPRRELSVTVDASGRLTDVRLTDSAYDLAARDLGALIVATARLAQQDAGEQAVELASAVFGAESPMVEHLRAEVESRATPDEA